MSEVLLEKGGETELRPSRRSARRSMGVEDGAYGKSEVLLKQADVVVGAVEDLPLHSRREGRPPAGRGKYLPAESERGIDDEVPGRRRNLDEPDLLLVAVCRLSASRSMAASGSSAIRVRASAAAPGVSINRYSGSVHSVFPFTRPRNDGIRRSLSRQAGCQAAGV